MNNKSSSLNLELNRDEFCFNINRKNTWSKKWDNVEAVFGNKDVVPMSIADMDFVVSKHIQEAIQRRSQHGVYGYVHQGADFFQSIVDWHKRKHNWEINKEWITSSPGVVAAQAISILALTNPGDEIIIQPPIYPPFYSVVQNNNRKVIENPLMLVNGRYVIDYADLEKKINNNTKILLFCSPHNPTGRCWNLEELEKIAELVIKHNLIVLSDEIFADSVLYGNRHIQLASLGPEIAHRTVTCSSPSKSFNLAGLSTSYTVIPNEDFRIRYRNQLAAIGIDEVNSFGLVALMAAYTKGDYWLQKMLEYVQGNLEMMANFISERIPHITLIYPEATFMAWLDCRKVSTDSVFLQKFFTDEVKLGLKNGSSFGTQGIGFMRINFACSRENLYEALERLETALKKLEYERE